MTGVIDDVASWVGLMRRQILFDAFSPSFPFWTSWICLPLTWTLEIKPIKP
jgi:hypothetical protein